MLQILNWLCLISICFLCSQVFVYMCKNTIDIFEDIKCNNQRKKVVSLNQDIPSASDELVNKIAK